jgi:Uma2 family endonuclease
MPRLKKADLIEGVVHVGTPVRLQVHAQPHADMATWLGTYRGATPGVFLAENATVRLDLENEVQPDALLRIAHERGGQSRVTEDDYLEGAPELVVEIAASSVSIDLHDKLRAYRRNEVQEYLVWRVLDEQVDWFQLSEGEYVPLQPDEEGLLQSRVFPGLRLDVEALLSGDLSRVLAVLHKGIVSKDHRAFLQRLTAGE